MALSHNKFSILATNCSVRIISIYRRRKSEVPRNTVKKFILQKQSGLLSAHPKKRRSPLTRRLPIGVLLTGRWVARQKVIPWDMFVFSDLHKHDKLVLLHPFRFCSFCSEYTRIARPLGLHFKHYVSPSVRPSVSPYLRMGPCWLL